MYREQARLSHTSVGLTAMEHSQPVGNAVPRQLGMGFPNGWEFAVLCKSDGVRGIVSHRGTQRHGEHGGQGEWGISDAEREQEYREERGRC